MLEKTGDNFEEGLNTKNTPTYVEYIIVKIQQSLAHIPHQ